MWPYLFGPGWPWEAALSAGVVAAIVLAIAVMLLRRQAGHADAAHDRIQMIWHAYEQGDLTEWEFARLITPRPAVQPRYIFPPAGAMPRHETVATHDAAAD